MIPQRTAVAVLATGVVVLPALSWWPSGLLLARCWAACCMISAGGYRTGYVLSLCAVAMAVAPFSTVKELRNFR